MMFKTYVGIIVYELLHIFNYCPPTCDRNSLIKLWKYNLCFLYNLYHRSEGAVHSSPRSHVKILLGLCGEKYFTAPWWTGKGLLTLRLREFSAEPTNVDFPSKHCFGSYNVGNNIHTFHARFSFASIYQEFNNKLVQNLNIWALF